MTGKALPLTDPPNIGKAIAADLVRLGITTPAQLRERDPLAIFHDLADVMGRRHDPCVLYTLLAARAFLDKGEARPWWEFTAEGKRLLKEAPDQGT
jgi:hypothetical protein